MSLITPHAKKYIFYLLVLLHYVWLFGIVRKYQVSKTYTLYIKDVIFASNNFIIVIQHNSLIYILGVIKCIIILQNINHSHKIINNHTK